MKNIGIFIPTIKPGGAEKQATLLAVLLDKYYHVDMYLNLGMLEPAQENLDLLGASQVVLHPLNGSTLENIFSLAKLLKKNKTDYLFNYMTNCDVIGCIAGKMARVPHIYGGIRNAYISYSKLLIERIIHNQFTSGSIYNCYSGAREIGGRGFDPTKNIVIPNCFPHILDPRTRSDKGVKHIVTVARYVSQKDYQTALKAIGILAKKRNDFVFDAIGYGVEEQNIRKWIEEYDVEKYVKLHIRPHDVQKIVGDSDIYLSTSLYEGTSNSIMEAMNWSLPVVATNVGDNNYLVQEGQSGFLHSKGDAEGIANSLGKLLDDSELRNRMGEKGNQILLEQYSMELFEKRYIDLIER